MPMFVLSSDVARAIALPSLTIVDQPDDLSAVTGTSASMAVAVAGGVAAYRYRWQAFTSSTSVWSTVRDVTLATTTDTLVVDLASVAAGQTRPYRCIVTDAAGQTVTTTTATVTVTPNDPARFWNVADGAPLYPVPPADGTRDTAGRLVRWVSTRAEVDANRSADTMLVLRGTTAAPIDYQDGRRLDLWDLRNFGMMAATRHGARWRFVGYSTGDNLIADRCDGLDLVGLDIARGTFYGVRLSAGPSWGRPAGGGNRNVRLLHLRFDDMAAGAVKADNGVAASTIGTGEWVTDGLEVGWCQFSRLGMSPPATNVEFAEAVYLGSGEFSWWRNRVRNVNLHHLWMDGANNGTGTGEAIEIKVGCENVRISDVLIDWWRTGGSSSGAAIAVAVNAGVDSDPAHVPTSGTEGYVIERARIFRTRTTAGWAAGNAIYTGHALTIRNSILAGNRHAAIAVKQKNAPSVPQFDYFGNPAELDLIVEHCTMVNNGSGSWLIDSVNPPHTVRIASVGNLTDDASYPTPAGISWVSRDDARSVAAGSLVGPTTGDADAGRGPGSGLAPRTATARTRASTLADDAMGRTRSGATAYGALLAV